MCNEKEDEVRNSVARLMSHSPQAAQRLRCHTDDSARKIKRAADHLTSKTLTFLGEDENETEAEDSPL